MVSKWDLTWLLTFLVLTLGFLHNLVHLVKLYKIPSLAILYSFTKPLPCSLHPRTNTFGSWPFTTFLVKCHIVTILHLIGWLISILCIISCSQNTNLPHERTPSLLVTQSPSPTPSLLVTQSPSPTPSPTPVVGKWNTTNYYIGKWALLSTWILNHLWHCTLHIHNISL